MAVASIGGGALALDRMHVATGDFNEYMERQRVSDERDYVLQLKKDIRGIMKSLSTRPNDEYLINSLADAIDDLCDLRPADRLCGA
ncbi:MAG: hypothetical protein GXP16_01445 [Gammaproteobacteria bacterium]|nr:hypothetical protein [Gammaproteobacteria bacterium]